MDPTAPFILSIDASIIGISGILRQTTEHGTLICYYKSRTLSDTEKRYDPMEREALAMYWSIQQLREYIDDSYFSIETDSQPLINFHKKQIDNKRVMHWLFKLQDIIPQITEVKHLSRYKNTGPDYLSKHSISSTSKKPIHDNDWPQGTETWEIKPQRPPSTFFAQLNAVITRQQAKRLLPAPLLTTFMATHTSLSSAPATTTSPSPQLFDFSLDRIRKEQMEDTDIIEILNMAKQNPSKS
ncbi:unnamed protein product [Didymodactylos carnosus]|uniref:Reverse transcriptase RNase H-like domain-containing protein n=1 Tax=Didymodactylos carnosus TaxID=1234261 RepID=A0A815Q4R7_9BILA|nr:unnamed protein product [Didymodactylos carnosus]CAF1457056.1 unnamed protein product [Didymodactylos carnosus]CAF4116573.1 unnamed protein product [Didymodactylos carnosus]CAF4328605.1 unnamed protein product [Didymodactylos carnosus]